jgi:hypothetical protein
MLHPGRHATDMTRLFRTRDDRWSAPSGEHKQHFALPAPVAELEGSDPVLDMLQPKGYRLKKPYVKPNKGRVCGMGDRCIVTWKLVDGDDVRYSCDGHLVLNAAFFDKAVITKEPVVCGR